MSTNERTNRCVHSDGVWKIIYQYNRADFGYIHVSLMSFDIGILG